MNRLTYTYQNDADNRCHRGLNALNNAVPDAALSVVFLLGKVRSVYVWQALMADFIGWSGWSVVNIVLHALYISDRENQIRL